MKSIAENLYRRGKQGVIYVRLRIPTKYLKRIMGHSSGDGVVTDDYGSGIPFEVLASYFAKIQFPSINAKPWEPGAGSIRKSNAAIN